MRYNIGEQIVMKCPVCRNVYSYGRMITHLCKGNTFFFGSIFSETPSEYQWNCCPHPKKTHKSTSIHSTIPNPSKVNETCRFELLSDQNSSKILYPWNCYSNQDDLNLVLNLTISDKQLIYE